MNIIIVDDEPKIRKGLSKLLGSHEGWVASGAFAEAESALSFLYEHEIDVIITDIQMPGMQGLDMVHQIRKVNREIPVIIISGYRHFDYAQKAIRFGVEDYLLKPLKALEINQTLRKMIEKYRVRDLVRLREETNSVRLERDARLLHERFMAAVVGDDGVGHRLQRVVADDLQHVRHFGIVGADMALDEGGMMFKVAQGKRGNG